MNNKALVLSFSITLISYSFISLMCFDLSNPQRLFLLIITLVYLLLLEYISYELFFVQKTRFGLSKSSSDWVALFSHIGICLVIAVIIEFATLLGSHIASYLLIEDWSLPRVLVFFLIIYGVSVFYYWYWRSISFNKFIYEIRDVCDRITAWRIAFVSCIVLALVIIGSIIASMQLYSQLHVFAFLLAIAIVIVALVLFWELHGTHPEYLFFVVSIVAGSVMAIFIPPITGVSWDDQIHFNRALTLSFVTDAEISTSEQLLIDSVGSQNSTEARELLGRSKIEPKYWERDVIQNPTSWTEDELRDYVSQLDKSSINDEYESSGSGLSKLGYAAISYLPSSIGLWIGRLLCLPLSIRFILGRLFNLLFYSLVCFAAIRIIPIKKKLLTVILLLPTELYMASSYSYDPWITSLLALAIALIIREIVEKPCFTMKSFIAICIAFILGLSAKAIYFPLVFLLLFIPSSKFTSKRRYHLFVLAAVLLSILIILSMAMPYISAGSTAGDARGGSNVSHGGQVSFILENPVTVAGLFFDFLINTYLAIPYANNATYFFYLGNASHWVPFLYAIFVPILAIISVIDNDSSIYTFEFPKKLITMVITTITLLLIVLVLYIDYNSVGSDTVKGVQWRYLIPLLAPSLIILSSLKIENHIDASLFSGISFLVSSTVLFMSIGVMVSFRVLC